MAAYSLLILLMPVISPSSVIGVAIVVAIAAAGSVSAVAENTLPGDALYPVKTVVNENVRRSLTFSAVSEARMEAHHALLRLREAGTLASASRLSPELNAELTRSFSLTSASVLDMADQASMSERAEEAASVLEDFRASLDEEESALVKITETLPAMQQTLDDLVALIRSTKSDVQRKMDTIRARITEGVEPHDSIEDDAHAALDTAAAAIDDLHTVLSTRKDISAEIREVLEGLAVESTQTLVRARAEFDRSSFSVAKALAEEALDFMAQAQTKLNSLD